ncbi:hypothetical protein CEK25_009334 [Fusarium fujikuroi]|nr:hypothetical protein CEK25_009334 [Fusarium fujikuroi]
MGQIPASEIRRQSRSQAAPPPPSKYSGISSAFSASANPDEDWTKIFDLAERQKLQNRIAQRNYRKKLKRRLEDLKRRAGSDDAESDKQLQKPTESKKGLQSLRGIRNRDTISKDNTRGDEARMDDLLASFGRRAMRVKPEALSWKQHIVGPGFEQKNGRIFEVPQSSERRPQVLRANTGYSYIDPTDDTYDMFGNTNLLLAEDDHESHGGHNGFVVQNIDGDQWIKPTVVPYSTTDGEDTIKEEKRMMPRQKGKGCSICSRRRIICDLGQPSCQKCLGRGFACPGYGPRLRWVQGVALRGHLRGIQFPIPESPASDSSPSLDNNTQQLLDYYDKNIAGLMVWIDSEKNYYRQKVLPLAQTNEAVRLAICAVSAQHAARDFTPSTVYEKDRDHVLSMIMRGVDDMTAHPQLTVTADTAEWMLSSMMVLSSYELAHAGGAEAADFHRKAARALVNTLSTLDFPKSSLFNFLQNQLSMYDIFACTTIFDTTDVQDAIRPIEFGEDRSFSAYLLLLRDVTLISRSGSAQGPTRDWRGEFVQARGETLMEVGSSGLCSSADRGDFIRLVDAYHNAALLYTARCLGHQHAVEETVSLLDLFQLLTGMENLHACIHNLAWPIFIAGTECYGDDDRQLIVRDLYQSLSDVTGFKHHGDVLTFLETFWSGRDPDWRVLANQWEGLGRRILAV